MVILFSICLAFGTVFVAQAGTNPPRAVVQAPPYQAPAPAPTPAPGNPVVLVSTSLGDITLELYKDRSPVSVANFLQYVSDGFYEGTIFHRVKPGFMIQGGGYTDTLVQKTTHGPILNEAPNGLKNARGTLAMARTRALRSATSQFYINLVHNSMLDHKSYSPEEYGYAVFGRVLAGMDIVDKIAAQPTSPKGEHEDLPTTPVVINKVTVVNP